MCFGLFRNTVVEIQARDEKIDLSAPRVSLLVGLVGSSAVSRLVDRSNGVWKVCIVKERQGRCDV